MWCFAKAPNLYPLRSLMYLRPAPLISHDVNHLDQKSTGKGSRTRKDKTILRIFTLKSEKQ